MTAGRSPVELLDTLDALRAKATPGMWTSPDYTSTVYGGDPRHLLRVTSSVHPDDAACIVAEHNAMPELLRLARERYALERAVLELCDSGIFDVQEWGERGSPYSNGGRRAFDRVRATVTAALTEGGQS